MEYIKCSNCGGETPSVFSRCRHCGERLAKQIVEEEINVPKERNGFVSFWLWAGLVINVLFSMGYFALLFSSVGLWSATPEPFPLRLFWVLACIARATGEWLLISWKKVGFYVFTAVAIVDGIISLCIAPSMLILISAIAPIIILYLILQIPKKGRSCWELLS